MSDFWSDYASGQTCSNINSTLPAGYPSIFTYQNVDVLHHYMKEHEASLEEATRAFDAVKQFLYTAVVVNGDHAPSQQIDRMWHTFIMFTQNYREFCEDRFGGFIDHVPSREPVAASTYMWTRENANRIFGDLDELMWPDLNRVESESADTNFGGPRPAPCNAPGQCNPKCNLKCNPVCNGRLLVEAV